MLERAVWIESLLEGKDVPLKDLAELGGWKTEQTILTCYQDSDLAAMRRAQERRRELREASAGGDEPRPLTDTPDGGRVKSLE